VTSTGRWSWLEPKHLTLLVLASLLLIRIRIALWLLPWSRVAVMTAPPPAPHPGFSVARLERAIRAASRCVPCASCLTQALALNRLLANNGHPSTVLIGVAKENGRFAAHAWVEWSGGLLLSSPAEVTQYSRCLTWPPRVT
jgi:Transglutaminase-like superfamily